MNWLKNMGPKFYTYHHNDSTELVWSQTMRYYNSNIGWSWNGSCEEDMGEIIGTGLCLFLCWLQRKDLKYHIKLLLLLIFCNTAVDCRHDGTNFLTHYSNSVGKIMCDMQIGWWRGTGKQKPLYKIGKLWILLLLVLQRPPREKMIQMTGKFRTGKHCE
jgi:hypothetical protein